jgi:hypothetical protein
MLLSNVSSRYGAPMGRPSTRPDADFYGVLRIARVRLDAGGYDSGGAYWGDGAPLYRVWDQQTAGCQIEWFTRAATRADVLSKVRTRYPNAVPARGAR